MEKESSVGVFIFSWIFIIMGMIVCLNIHVIKIPKPYTIIPIFFFVAYWLVFLFLGNGALVFNNISRRLIILLSAVFIIIASLGLYSICRRGVVGKPCEKPPSARERMIGDIECGLVASSIFNLPFLVVIYYFTRPKVKRVFSERNPERPKEVEG